ncbi:hypothetical protein MNBD_GAMMA23-1012 [hydrothermal vent metagenome]|uniref:Periplasmic chaperone PpiD n=1 Tax=hydrothermal vent metagenome TaxID=652676 RepID=A0A3B0ZQG6_9ZZZZ
MWGIVGLIIVPFALFGVQDYITGGAKTVPAVVNGYEISSAQLTRAVQARKQQLEQQLGSSYNPDFFPTDMLRQQVLDELIARQLISEFTVNSNMSASPQQVFADIKQVPQFKDASGNFSAKIYTRALKGAGRDKAVFEANIARDFVLNQLREGVFNSTFVLPYEVQQTQNLLNQQREIGYLTFAKLQYKKNKDISEEALKKYYKSHLNAYRTQEKVNIEYVELDINAVAAKIEIEDKAIADYYESNISHYTEKDYPAALVMINNVRRRIDNGESFEALAKKLSADKLSGKKGGDIGFISKGIMDKAFDAVAFKLKKGEISKPVKDKFGYHLIKLVEIKGDERQVKHIQIKAVDKSKDLNVTLRAQIKAELQLQEAEKNFFEDVEKFSTLAYENSGSLEAVAAGLDLDIKSSGLVLRQGLKGILSSPQVSSAIYSKQVLSDHKNSEVIELKDTHMIVVRVKEHQPAAQKVFEDVKADVAKKVTLEQQTNAMKADVNAAFQKLTSGSKGNELAAQYKNSKWVVGEFVSRRSARQSGIPVAIIQQSFSLPRPAADKPSIGIADLPTGDQAIVVVSAIKDVNQTDTAESSAIREQLQKINQNVEYLGFEQYLKDNADISINLGKDTD